jgi:ABC-2 type transport system permease protein
MVTAEASNVREPGNGTTEQAEVSPARRFGWLLRRELWESRSLYLAPLAVAGLALVGGVIGVIRLAQKMSDGAALAPDAIREPFLLVSLLIMATTFLVGIVYAFDALQSERRDRSILFWKSLPVSDLATVLAKAAFPLAILPVLTVVLAVIVHLAMLLAGSAALLAQGQGAAALWSQVDPVGTVSMLLYHMLVVHALWHAPFYGWMFLVSAWARRVPWLWAILPPLAIAVVEHVAFGTSVFTRLLMYRLGGESPGAEHGPASGSMDPMAAPADLLVRPGMWLGLALTALFLALAVRLRRRRGPA